LGLQANGKMQVLRFAQDDRFGGDSNGRDLHPVAA
jgi:hypothetical protein